MQFFKFQIITGFLLITPSLCQFMMTNEMRPDVTFGDHNDRFDIANLVDEQHNLEKYLAGHRRHRYKKDRAKSEKMQSSSGEGSLRRRGVEVRGFYPGQLYARRFGDADFAYHDDMAEAGGNVDDFEKALEVFRTKNARRRLRNFVKYLRAKPKRRSLRKSLQKKSQRRSSGQLNDLMLHYEVPTGMKISGFIKVPQAEVGFV